MRKAWLFLVGLSVLGAAADPDRVMAQLRDSPLPFNEGQSVTPSFEGWFKNPDGTFSLSFGYMNRNRKQELLIPVGPNNKFEPGPADRGQPTHFVTRRQTGVFTVVVPADFKAQTLTWTLVSNGETIAVPGHLRPEWQIDALKELTSGNTPPALRFDPNGTPVQGPGGITTTMTASRSDGAVLSVWVTDDMVPERPSTEERPAPKPAVGVFWSQHRGPGKVTFSEQMPAIDPAGKAVTKATFSEPGEYVLRVLAWEGTGHPMARGVMAVGFQCCWTNGFVKVVVKS